MIKQMLMVKDMAGELCPLEITVVERESDLWAIEEPVEPVITITKEHNSWWVYSDDKEAYGHGFEDLEVLAPPYGSDDSLQKERAVEYAQNWAKAVRGGWEEI